MLIVLFWKGRIRANPGGSGSATRVTYAAFACSQIGVWLCGCVFSFSGKLLIASFPSSGQSPIDGFGLVVTMTRGGGENESLARVGSKSWGISASASEGVSGSEVLRTSEQLVDLAWRAQEPGILQLALLVC